MEQKDEGLCCVVCRNRSETDGEIERARMGV